MHQNWSHPRDTHCQAIGSGSRKSARAPLRFGDRRCGKDLPKRGCICTHSRALPRDDHHLLGVHKARSSAQGPRQLSASSTGSRRRWDRFVELMVRSNALESGFAARRAVACRATGAPELGHARRRNVVAAPRGPGGPCGHRGGHPMRAPWCELGLQHSVEYMWSTG